MDAPPARVYEFGDFRFDVEERTLIPRHGPPVSLTPRVFETLRYLVEHAGRVADKESLMDAIWPDCVVEENNLAQNISTLRRIFGDRNGTSRYIATVPGRGYRFLPEVRTKDEPPPVAQRSSLPEMEKRAGSLRHVRSAGVAVVAVLLLGIGIVFWWRSAPSSPALERSIAVLPFANLSDDPANVWFAEGMKDEILTRLAKIGALKVISRTSTQKFAGAPHDVREIGRQLGVAYVLEGSVQKFGETVRVTVQLIHAPSDNHLWAETYDRKLTDMFQVESEVAQRIASSLEATLTGSEKQALLAHPTTNVEAYREYLQGRFFWNKRTMDGFRNATGHFERALELDPAYAQACVGLADAIFFIDAAGPAREGEATRKGRALLQKALELDEALPEAHASLGLLAMNVDWDWAKAEKEFRRALELNPNYATAHQWYGEFLAYMGRFDEAFQEIGRARELDPLSLIIATDEAKILLLARRYDEAIQHFQAALKMEPEFAEALGLLGLTYSKMGQHEKAIESLRAIKHIEDLPPYLAWLAYAYGVAGRKEEARAAVTRLNELGERIQISPFSMATAWIGSGDNETAFSWLERVFATRAPGGGVSLKVNPLFDPLRSDPRYTDLLRRANFAPAQ